MRTLCDDIGEALQCGAHLEKLVRTRTGSLSLDEAHDLDAILNMDIQELEEASLSLTRFTTEEDRVADR